jgi:hypothetical protein
MQACEPVAWQELHQDYGMQVWTWQEAMLDAHAILQFRKPSSVHNASKFGTGLQHKHSMMGTAQHCGTFS